MSEREQGEVGVGRGGRRRRNAMGFLSSGMDTFHCGIDRYPSVDSHPVIRLYRSNPPGILSSV